MRKDTVKAALRRYSLWILPLAVALAGCGDDASDADNTVLAGLDFPTDCEIGPCEATTTTQNKTAGKPPGASTAHRTQPFLRP